jgi:pilus assembly protein CpaE
MSQPIRTLVALDTGIDPSIIVGAAPADSDIAIVGVVEGMDSAWRALEDSSCDVLVVACLGYSERALSLIDSSVKQDPHRPVLVLSQGSPNGFVRRVFEAGADDILMLPQSPEQIRFSINKLITRKLGPAGSGHRDLGRLLCVLGPKGGSGKTLVSANLSVALAGIGQRVAIVDLDLQFGDVGLCMGIGPERTIYDLTQAGGTLDSDKLDAYLATHESGVRVLLAPTRPDQASSITVELIRDIYSALRATYDYVIVDTPPGFTAEVIASIDASTDLVVVGMLDSLSLKNTKLGLETLELMGYGSDAVKLVLNRAHSRVGISQSDVVAVLGGEPDVYVPSDREIPRAVNEGVPIVLAKPDSEAAAAFRQLASSYVEGAAPELAAAGVAGSEAGPPRRRLFGRKA